MGTADEHRSACLEARSIALALKASYPTWAVVPLFYSALHLIHTDLASCADIPEDMRHPESHVSTWVNKVRVLWGTSDIVATVYPSDVSRPYKALLKGSHAARYDCMTFDENQEAGYWRSYDRLVQALPAELLGA